MGTKKFKYGEDKAQIAAELQERGIIEKYGIHEVADDGIYKLWTTPDRLNRKKVACFIDIDAGYLVHLPRECPEYRRECDRDHGKIRAIGA